MTDPDDFARFGELVQVACQQGELGLAALREAERLLSEMASAAVVLADHVVTETSALPKRHVLQDDTNNDPRARLAEIHERTRRVAKLFAEAALHAHRSSTALTHISTQDGNPPPDREDSSSA